MTRVALQARVGRYLRLPVRWLLPSIATGIRSMGAAILSPNCPCCRMEMGWGKHGVCGACWSEVLPAGQLSCELCSGALAFTETVSRGFRCPRCLEDAARDGSPPFTAVVSWGHYDGRLRDLVHAFKYEGRPGLARPIGERLAEALLARELGPRLTGCLVVPVPLARDRRRERGYDQALLLARRLRDALRRRRFAPSRVAQALRRLRGGPPQTGLARKERLINPRGAYGPARGAAVVRGSRVLLVDDVLTTGATAAECSTILLGAGAREVIVAVAARTPARSANLRSTRGSSGGDGEID